MIPFDPFAWFYSLIGFLQELWSRLIKSLARRIQETKLFRKVYELFLNTPIGSERKEAPELQESVDSSFSERTAEFFQFLLHVSIVRPYYAFIGLLGLSFEWLVSRQWGGISILSVPMLLLAITSAAVWYGGRLDRFALSDRYFKLGIVELEKAEDSMAASSEKTKQDQNSTRPVSHSKEIEPPVAKNMQTPDSDHYFAYAELLFNRSLLLRPNKKNQWRYLLGATLLDNSAYDNGKRMLRRIAPDDGRGMPEAHAAIATSILNQFNRNGDQELMKPFLHHAKIALSWRGTPKEVLIALSAAYWQTGAQEESLNVLKITAERFEGLYTTVFQRAVAVGNQKIAEELKLKAIAELESALAKEPGNSKIRVRLVQLYDTDRAGLVRAEEKIREGIDINPDPLLSRALSEIYRIAFVRQLIESQQALADFNLLEIAFQADPSNPLVTDQISSIVTDHKRPLEELSEGLYRILASGSATACIHAILAEIQMYSNKPEASLGHLEQVYQRAPHAAKYTTYLARIYAEKQKTDEAIQICIESLSVLDQNGQLKERYVDELLHTVGELFMKVGRHVDAESAFENALKANPDRENTRSLLIQHYRTVGKEQEASVLEKYLAERVNPISDPTTTAPNP